MNRFWIFILLSLVANCAVWPSSFDSTTAEHHTEWVAKSLTEMESIKPGMTRMDLLKVFKEEGGISSRSHRRYAYRNCPYIKVDVEFEPVGQPNNFGENPKDKIKMISTPFIERPIFD